MGLWKKYNSILREAVTGGGPWVTVRLETILISVIQESEDPLKVKSFFSSQSLFDWSIYC